MGFYSTLVELKNSYYRRCMHLPPPPCFFWLNLKNVDIAIDFRTGWNRTAFRYLLDAQGVGSHVYIYSFTKFVLSVDQKTELAHTFFLLFMFQLVANLQMTHAHKDFVSIFPFLEFLLTYPSASCYEIQTCFSFGPMPPPFYSFGCNLTRQQPDAESSHFPILLF